ncbi:MAG: hypothetical protein U0736_06160 [Gemmataceae bacterium]
MRGFTTGPGRGRRPGPLARAGGVVLAGLLGMSGCQGTPVARENDPLVGGSPIPTRPAGRLAGPERPVDPLLASGPAEPAPLPQPATTPPSPAALASGTSTPGDLRTAASEVNLKAPRPTDARLVPVDPLPAGTTLTPTAATATTTTAATPTGGGSDTGDSYERLQRQLLARGVVWQQLKNVERDEWHFICAIPDPQQPNVRRNYEARAAGPLGLAAIRAAIDEIDRERY